MSVFGATKILWEHANEDVNCGNSVNDHVVEIKFELVVHPSCNDSFFLA